MDLTEKAAELYGLLFTKSFDIDALKRALLTGSFSKEDVNLAAYKYVDDCQNDLLDDDWEIHHGEPGEVVLGYESSHMLEAIRVLLEYGLDPNTIFTEALTDEITEEYNIMQSLRYIDNGYVAADTLALLLENGGNPSLIIDGNSFVRDVNFDLIFDLNNQEDRIRYDALVHFWMVLVGYGARLEHGEPCVDPCGDFDVGNLRNHRQYYYGAIESDRSNDHMEICFFDKETNWEVARF